MKNVYSEVQYKNVYFVTGGKWGKYCQEYAIIVFDFTIKELDLKVFLAYLIVIELVASIELF